MLSGKLGPFHCREINSGLFDEKNRPAAQRLESIRIYLHRCEWGSVHRYSVEMVVE